MPRTFGDCVHDVLFCLRDAAAYAAISLVLMLFICGLGLLAVVHATIARPYLAEARAAKRHDSWVTATVLSWALPLYGLLVPLLYFAQFGRLVPWDASNLAARRRGLTRLAVGALTAACTFGFLAVIGWPQGRADNFAIHAGLVVGGAALYALACFLYQWQRLRVPVLVVWIVLAVVGGRAAWRVASSSCDYGRYEQSALCEPGESSGSSLLVAYVGTAALLGGGLHLVSRRRDRNG